MEDAKVTGVIHLIEPVKTYGAKGFRKRLVVLEQEDGRFPNYIPVEFTQEKCELVDDLKVGATVEVAYRLRGRRWDRDGEVKFFVNVEAVEVRPAGQAGDGPAPGPDVNDYEDEIRF